MKRRLGVPGSRRVDEDRCGRAVTLLKIGGATKKPTYRPMTASTAASAKNRAQACGLPDEGLA
jgi:hypothetical protein